MHFKSLPLSRLTSPDGDRLPHGTHESPVSTHSSPFRSGSRHVLAVAAIDYPLFFFPISRWALQQHSRYVRHALTLLLLRWSFLAVP